VVLDDDDLEEVPLTPEEQSEIAEAWLAYIHALPPGGEPDLRLDAGSASFKMTINRILLAHGFEPFSATLSWSAEKEAVLLARRLPSVTEPLDT
jgi:hypothetical protein